MPCKSVNMTIIVGKLGRHPAQSGAGAEAVVTAALGPLVESSFEGCKRRANLKRMCRVPLPSGEVRSPKGVLSLCGPARPESRHPEVPDRCLMIYNESPRAKLAGGKMTNAQSREIGTLGSTSACKLVLNATTLGQRLQHHSGPQFNFKVHSVWPLTEKRTIKKAARRV